AAASPGHPREQGSAREDALPAHRAHRTLLSDQPLLAESAVLLKKTAGTARPARWGGGVAAHGAVMDRRTFLQRSGLAAGTVAAISSLPLATVKRAEAATAPHPTGPVTIRKNVCTHCSVACTVRAEVQNGVWVGQEPNWDSPINLGTHCAKGAATREL